MTQTHGCLPILYRRHPFCFLLNPLVIVISYSSRESFKRIVALLTAIEHFGFHSAKKSFHDAVVITVPFARHRLDNAVFFKRLTVISVLILPSLVGMYDKTLNVRKFLKSAGQHPSDLIKNWMFRQVIRYDFIGVHV